MIVDSVWKISHFTNDATEKLKILFKLYSEELY